MRIKMSRVERNEKAKSMLAVLGVVCAQKENHFLHEEDLLELGKLVADDLPMLLNVLAQHLALFNVLTSLKIRDIENESAFVTAKSIQAIKDVNQNSKAAVFEF